MLHNLLLVNGQWCGLVDLLPALIVTKDDATISNRICSNHINPLDFLKEGSVI